MDTMLQPPSATAFDAVSSTVSAALYLLVALAAILRAPRDPRTRLFLLIALTGAAPFSVSVLMWAKGAAALTRPVIAIVAVSLTTGSLALFHFAQIFPWRRPWIRAHWPWLLAGYVVLPLLAAVLAARTSILLNASEDAYSSFSSVEIGGLVALLLPTLFIVGVVVPLGGLLSLFKNWQAAKRAGIAAARVTTLWMLISQLAGGVLTILVVPLVHLVAPTGPWAIIAAALLFGFGLLMPIAFAAGIWKYGVLQIDPDQPSQTL
jgi:hypothetical protein